MSRLACHIVMELERELHSVRRHKRLYLCSVQTLKCIGNQPLKSDAMELANIVACKLGIEYTFSAFPEIKNVQKALCYTVGEQH